MKKLLVGICAILLLFSYSYSTASDASVNPPPGAGSSKCTVSSNPSNNVGYCINFFGGDYCTGKSSGTIAPACDGTIKPL